MCIYIYIYIYMCTQNDRQCGLPSYHKASGALLTTRKTSYCLSLSVILTIYYYTIYIYVVKKTYLLPPIRAAEIV